MSRDLDPEHWGDYPERSELLMDQCQRKGCRNANEEPHSRFCWWDASDKERAEIEAAREAFWRAEREERAG